MSSNGRDRNKARHDPERHAIRQAANLSLVQACNWIGERLARDGPQQQESELRVGVLVRMSCEWKMREGRTCHWCECVKMVELVGVLLK